MDGTMMDFPLTLPHILERAGKLFPRVEIVSRLPDRSLHRYTYGDFYRRARALAEALERAGLRRGDRVGTLMWNHYAHLEAYFGVPSAGGVVHTLNVRLHADDIAYIAKHAGDRFLIVDDVLLPVLEPLRHRLQVERVFVVPLSGEPVPAGDEDYEAFLEDTSGTFTYPTLDENEAAGMCYTSGTTGRPKGVVYSHRALVVHSLVMALIDSFAISQRAVVLPVVPMFHVNAWGLPYAATMAGAKQVLPGPHLDAESLLDLIEGERVTLTAGVPTVWLDVLQALEAEADRWRLEPGLRVVIGGQAAPESLLRGLDRLGLRPFHAWGMTETTPLGTISTVKTTMDELSEEARFTHRAKQGLPPPFVEIRVVNDAGEAPWDDETLGELQVRGPYVAATYYNRPDAGERWTEDGWFRTSDVASIDPEGYLKIADRTSDLIKSGGEWISSVELENALMSHPAVREAAVVAVPHPRWQERPLAAVVLREGKRTTAAKLRAHLAPRFAKWWLPDAIVFVDEIPRTAAGKFQKAELRERFKDWRWDD